MVINRRCAPRSQEERQALLLRSGFSPEGHDPVFAAPAKCAPHIRDEVAMLNDVHRSWEARKLFSIDSRLTGEPHPLYVVNFSPGLERKSPNAVCDRLRRWTRAPACDAQVRQRAALRLLRDGVLAAIRYYGLDPHEFDLPTDADILTWSPSKVRSLTQAARQELFKQIMRRELPEAEILPARERPRMDLRVNVERRFDPAVAAEECYVAFTPPKPFWRREGEPLFCVPLMASSSRAPSLFAGLSVPQSFATRGPMRYKRVGTGHFVAQGYEDDEGSTTTSSRS